MAVRSHVGLLHVVLFPHASGSRIHDRLTLVPAEAIRFASRSRRGAAGAHSSLRRRRLYAAEVQRGERGGVAAAADGP